MRKLVVSLAIALMVMVSFGKVYAHSGRTTTNSWGQTGHYNRSTGYWHSHY